MNIDPLKEDVKTFIENLIIKCICKQTTNINNLENIREPIKNFIEKIKLTDKDYNQIERNIISKLITSKKVEISNEVNYLIETFSNIMQFTSIELNIDDDTCIYFHTYNNKTYLINYDSIENNWYLSLIETNSLNLIEEIYNNKYKKFIDYINNLKSR